MHLGPVHHSPLEFLEVPGCDGLGVRQLGGKHKWDAYLVGVDVGVRRDDRARRVVDPLTHHVLTEQALFLLQQLWAEGDTV